MHLKKHTVRVINMDDKKPDNLLRDIGWMLFSFLLMGSALIWQQIASMNADDEGEVNVPAIIKRIWP